jgi:pimeloyl-ACP methyl ester carboxylesterase
VRSSRPRCRNDGGAAELPGPAPRVTQALAESAAHPPTNEEERIEAAVRLWAALAGSGDPANLAALRAREIRVRARARNIAAAQNHGLAVANSPDRMDALRTVKVPTLVIHGTDDPILPVEHGKATAACIPGATELLIGGMGHEIPVRVEGEVLRAIISHTSATSPFVEMRQSI